MSVSNAAIAVPQGRAGWQAGLTRKHWRILWGSYLGWIFDGYEAFALVVALPPALHTLLTPQTGPGSADLWRASPSAPLCSAGASAVSAGGILADYFGRKRMLMLSVLSYACLTGLTAFSTSLAMLVGDALPDRARDRRGVEHRNRAGRRILARPGAPKGPRLPAIGVRRGHISRGAGLVRAQRRSSRWAAKPGG